MFTKLFVPCMQPDLFSYMTLESGCFVIELRLLSLFTFSSLLRKAMKLKERLTYPLTNDSVKPKQLKVSSSKTVLNWILEGTVVKLFASLRDMDIPSSANKKHHSTVHEVN